MKSESKRALREYDRMGIGPFHDDGMVTVLDGPELGVEYDWDYITDNQTGSSHVYK